MYKLVYGIDKTDGIVESIILAFIFTLPLVFISSRILVVTYVFFLIFIFVGTMCQVFSYDGIIFTSAIKNVIATRDIKLKENKKKK